MLSTDDVLQIHMALVAEFASTDNPIDPPGVKSEHLLASAVFRQESGGGGRLKYPEAIENAATLAYGICCDHPFHNGNKRTALVALLVHLDRNKLTFYNVQPAIKQADLYQLVLDIATHEVIDPRRKLKRTQSNRVDPDDEVRAIAHWIRQRADQVVRGDHPITYRQLGQILPRFKYYLENQHGNSVDIVRHFEETIGFPFINRRKQTVSKRVHSLSYRGETEPLPINTIKMIRRICNLCEEDGVTSATFYSEGEIIDSFINRYRNILRKLANK